MNIMDRLKKTWSKDELKKELREEQNKIDKQYEAEGGGDPSDEVLEKQVQLNTRRHQTNISDETKAIYKNFVQ